MTRSVAKATRAAQAETVAQEPSTRDRILHAALAEFASRGLSGARVGEIAARAGINKQALYYYFGSKAQLFQAALTFGYAQDLATLDLTDDVGISAVSSLQKLVGTLFDHFRSHPNMLQMLAHENRAQGAHLSADVRNEAREAVSPILHAIRSIIKRGQRDGVFAAKVDPVQVYLTVVATCMFYFANAYTMSAIVAEDLLADVAIAKRRRHLQDVLVNGLRIQPNG